MRVADLLATLDIAAMECLDDDSFRLLGTIPAWLRRLRPGVAAEQEGFQPGKIWPFLEHFLVDAADFWAQHKAGPLLSGPWCETDSAGNTYALEASARRLGRSKLLFLQLLGSAYEEHQAILQKARTTSLDYHRLIRTEEALRHSEAKLAKMLAQIEQSHADVVSILNQLRLGTAMLDEHGCITFVSQACQRLLGKSQEGVVGKPWEQVTPFSSQVKAQLQAMAADPPQHRSKLPAHLETPQGQHYWMEIEVQDDPRDRRRKIIVLYDMTEVHDLRRLLDEKAQFYDLIGKSEPILRVYQQIRELARVDTTVLIEGETGTGKELVARAIHFASHRQDKPFIAVNCAGLTESLLASQLFGHKRGAFTGAIADHQGLFEAAHRGTIFLDEIGDIPLSVQTNLLRVLQEREITRLGESKPRKIDLRILAATHHNLPDEVAKGTFRVDLLYRIRVARVHLPPLRERREDIPLLASAFLAQCRAAIGKPVHEISREAMRLLMTYSWPGNIRELKSAMEFAVIHSTGTVLHAEDLPPECAEFGLPAFPTGGPLRQDQQRLLAALEQAQGNRTAAARRLGISRATLYRRLSNLEILPPPYHA
jgi:PAS domain S-box-containing protein